MKKLETKKEKFKRLGETRVNKIVKQIELLGNLSNRGAYEFTELQVKDIFRLLRKELKYTEERFSRQVEKIKRIEL